MFSEKQPLNLLNGCGVGGIGLDPNRICYSEVPEPMILDTKMENSTGDQ
jgi:hypothetical protein